MEYIKRHIEKCIKRGFSTYKVVLITGARQVGKTRTIKELFSNFKYVTLDNIFSEELAREDGLQFLENNECPLIIDEVQKVPKLFRSIKVKCDEDDNYGKYILSGSQLFKLMENASDSLSGRVHILELQPLSLREIIRDDYNERFIPNDKFFLDRSKYNNKISDMWEIIHRGMYPELQYKDKDWESFYVDYVKTYIERDVRELINVSNLSEFAKFLSVVAARTGQIVNYSNISNELGISVDTVKKWISILETSNIIYLLKPYGNIDLKRAIKTPKIYFRDTGLVCYLTKWLTKDTLMNGAQAGSIFETFIVSEILKTYSNAGYEYRDYIYYYNGYDNKKQTQSEIDLIIDIDGTLYPVEIKMTTKPSIELANNFSVLKKIKNKNIGNKTIICTCDGINKLSKDTFAINYAYI